MNRRAPRRGRMQRRYTRRMRFPSPLPRIPRRDLRSRESRGIVSPRIPEAVQGNYGAEACLAEILGGNTRIHAMTPGAADAQGCSAKDFRIVENIARAADTPCSRSRRRFEQSHCCACASIGLSAPPCDPALRARRQRNADTGDQPLAGHCKLRQPGRSEAPIWASRWDSAALSWPS